VVITATGLEEVKVRWKSLGSKGKKVRLFEHGADADVDVGVGVVVVWYVGWWWHWAQKPASFG
jgi:hypothetical protein